MRAACLAACTNRRRSAAACWPRGPTSRDASSRSSPDDTSRQPAPGARRSAVQRDDGGREAGLHGTVPTFAAAWLPNLVFVIASAALLKMRFVAHLPAQV